MKTFARHQLKVIALVAGISPGLALAGGWISSGGELLRDAHNPWFIHNTSVVRYCVQVDAASISISEAKVVETLGRALQYWQGEFTSLNFMLDVWDKSRTYTARAGTQRFDLQSCDGKEDIRFQFGFGTLTPDQKEFFEGRPNPTVFNRLPDVVGISVRTHYDSVNLKGRGFVYIGSDRGPVSVNIPAGSAGMNSVITDVWSKPARLFHVLVHELGHVYGLAHMGNGEYVVDTGAWQRSNRQIMAENYPERAVTNRGDPYFDAFDVEPFFLSKQKMSTCNLSEDVRKALALTPELTCVDAYITPVVVGQTEFTIDLVAFGLGPIMPKVLGRLSYKIPQTTVGSDYRFTISVPIVVKLSSQQNVFESVNVPTGVVIAGYRTDFMMMPMDWVGTKYHFFVLMTPERFDIVLQGRP